MSRPADLPSWATAAPGADVVDPGNAKEIAGWDFEESPAYNFVNWFWNQVTRWTIYLDERVTYLVAKVNGAVTLDVSPWNAIGAKAGPIDLGGTGWWLATGTIGATAAEEITNTTGTIILNRQIDPRAFAVVGPGDKMSLISATVNMEQGHASDSTVLILESRLRGTFGDAWATAATDTKSGILASGDQTFALAHDFDVLKVYRLVLNLNAAVPTNITIGPIVLNATRTQV